MNLPEIEFVKTDVEELEAAAVKLVEETLNRSIARADPLRLLLKSLLAIIVQQRALINEVARENLLAYASGDNLDHIGALVGVARLSATCAKTTVIIKLSASRQQVTTIKKGTRITADGSVFFSLDEDVVLSSGEMSKTCAATCTIAGVAGNGYAAGEINRLVEPQAFVRTIENITTSAGGSDVESDEAFRERLHAAPESFSVAGSEGAYIYHAKSVSPLISDVAVTSPDPGKVNVYVLLQGGAIPDAEILNAVDNHLNAKTIRPLTDYVRVFAPQIENYDLNVTYWINREDATQAATIVEEAQKAVDDFVNWQKEKLGRDLNPSELTARLMKAGVKRCDIASPAFKSLNPYTVAVANDINLTFGGFEDI